MAKGKVYLIGAGPGDPDLITVKGLGCISEADVIVYDNLVNKVLLDSAKSGAEIIFVGKVGGLHTVPQDKINALLVKKARSGKIVARLKGGDPFIFGRGGEEAEELARAAIPFEVVPGVTSAVAAPAYAGIPLTHRKHTSSVAFVTGHEATAKGGSSVPWDNVATSKGTIVFLMGVKNLAHNVARLIEHGRDPRTPIALIRWGTTAQQETLVGRLDNIVDLAEERGMRPPVVAVVGEVVAIRERINWFEGNPLFGRRIMVTRSREQASGLSSLLAREGAEPYEFPTIATVAPESWRAVDRAIRRLSRYEWAIFTSVNGVKCFFDRLVDVGKDLRELKGVKIAAIGPATAEAVEALGIPVDITPQEYRAEGLLKGLGWRRIRGKRFLLPRALVARDILPEEIVRLGGKIDVVPVYRTIRPRGKREEARRLLKDGEIDAVTFTSSSTVSNFLAMFKKGEGVALLENTKVACIGPITADTARQYGVEVDIMASRYTMSGLTAAMGGSFSGEERAE
ncbi:MAG: uroporphyrinogen-III C-methyltransferase [Deltaproteobacteria bacterium]|nr:uroporphyrinogen-III C-methyltransferase [Deltaproteobacteria bacterium]